MSRPLYAACHSPELIQDVFAAPRTAPAMESLLAWLAHWGRHLKCLTVKTWDIPRQGCAELSTRLLDCLRAAHSLEDLDLTLPALDSGGVAALAQLPSFSVLRFQPTSSTDQKDFDASQLTGLLSLELDGVHVRWEAGRPLPFSLPQLCIKYDESDSLAEQARAAPGIMCDTCLGGQRPHGRWSCPRVGVPRSSRPSAAHACAPSHPTPSKPILSVSPLHFQVSRLLEVVTHASRDGLGFLPQLGAHLTCLDLQDCPLPASLPALRALRHLVLVDWWFGPGSDNPMLDASLAQLTLLTSLALGPPENDAEVSEILPPAVLRLAHLQCCLFLPGWTPRRDLRPLPAQGPWLRSLRWLGAPLHILLASGAALASSRRPLSGSAWPVCPSRLTAATPSGRGRPLPQRCAACPWSLGARMRGAGLPACCPGWVRCSVCRPAGLPLKLRRSRWKMMGHASWTHCATSALGQHGHLAGHGTLRVYAWPIRLAKHMLCLPRSWCLHTAFWNSWTSF